MTIINLNIYFGFINICFIKINGVNSELLTN